MAPSIQHMPMPIRHAHEHTTVKQAAPHIPYPAESDRTPHGGSVGDSEAGHINLDHTTASVTPRDVPEHYNRHPKGPPPRRRSDTDLHASFTSERTRPVQRDVKTQPRPFWDEFMSWRYTRTREPGWTLGDGANDGGDCLRKAKHVCIDPYEEGRPATSNYKLLISGIGPRPTVLVSTRSKDGKSTNLAPFSYVQMMSVDPPLFALGFASGFDQPRDTLVNLAATRECTVNIVSEHFVEAASSCSMNLPYGLSEWATSGLTPLPCEAIHPECSRVAEAVFSAECTLLSTQEFTSRRDPKKKTAVLALLEAKRFWVREDAVDKDLAKIDPDVLRPLGRMGDITFCRAIEGFQVAKVRDPEGEIRRLHREHLVRRKHKDQDIL